MALAPHAREVWLSPGRLIALALGALGIFLLFTDHQGHVLRLLPYLLLAACPLLHMFMHRGHQHRQQ